MLREMWYKEIGHVHVYTCCDVCCGAWHRFMYVCGRRDFRAKITLAFEPHIYTSFVYRTLSSPSSSSVVYWTTMVHGRPRLLTSHSHAYTCYRYYAHPWTQIHSTDIFSVYRGAFQCESEWKRRKFLHSNNTEFAQRWLDKCAKKVVYRIISIGKMVFYLFQTRAHSVFVCFLFFFFLFSSFVDVVFLFSA